MSGHGSHLVAQVGESINSVVPYEPAMSRGIFPYLNSERDSRWKKEGLSPIRFTN